MELTEAINARNYHFMMNQSIENVDEIIAYKARKAAAIRASRLIMQMVNEVEREKSLERTAILSALLVFMLTMLSSILLLG